jgi:hypothetical protein
MDPTPPKHFSTVALTQLVMNNVLTYGVATDSADGGRASKASGSSIGQCLCSSHPGVAARARAAARAKTLTAQMTLSCPKL